MFRYLAFAWNPADPNGAACAAAMNAQWADVQRARPQRPGADSSEWILAHVTRGLRVHMTGARPGVNQAFALLGDRGNGGNGGNGGDHRIYRNDRPLGIGPADGGAHGGAHGAQTHAHAMDTAQGVILGKVFRTERLHLPAARHIELTSVEQQRILSSHGDRLLDEFWGRYVAFLPSSRGLPSVLRDPSGALPCFRLEHEGVVLIFSWLEDAMALLERVNQTRSRSGPPLAVNWAAVGALARYGALTGRETALQGLSEVLAGERHQLPFGPTEVLWSAPAIAAVPVCIPDEVAALELATTVRACARAWAASNDRILLRLSGGVDSSILMSTLAPQGTATDVVAINYHSVGADSDEREYARQMAAIAGRELIEQERDTDFRLDQVLRAARMPAPVPYIGWMNARADASLALTHQARAMFTGTGGDALFDEFPRWWPAADYLHDRGIDAGVLTAMLDAARLGRVSIWRAAVSAIRETLRPGLAERSSAAMNDLLSPSLGAQPVDADRFAHPGWRAAARLPPGKRNQTQALMYPMGYYDPFERERAPELVTPLLSQPLIELCLRLPTYQLTAGGWGRGLARRAFAPVLPVQIARRRSKGGMEEHVRAVLDANMAQIRALLLEGQLCQRGLLDRRAMEARLSGMPTALPGTVTQLHGLVAIEAWLTHWRH